MGWYDQVKEDHLEHHGIKGQKWGVRRFQNYDGTRTLQGKNRLVSKKNKNHKFTDKSDVSINKRQETLDGLMGLWGLTAVSSISGAAIGGASVGAIGAVVGGVVMSTPYNVLAVAETAKFVKRDVQANKANKKEKQFAEERAQNPVDKKTGFHKKTKEMSPEEDMERVNPAYKNWDENTKSNCVLCTMSMELRRRGYDVQAKKATSGYNANEIVKDWFVGSKPKEQEGGLSDTALNEYYRRRQYPKIDKDSQKKLINNTMSEIQNQKDGARGQLAVTWDGTWSGHSITYANEGGKVVIYDTQANKKYEDKAAEKYLTQCSQITVTRLDNCDINLKYIKEVAS